MSAEDRVRLRRERAADRAAIHAVHVAAFGRADEGDLVDRLRHEGAVLASFLAEDEGLIVGHVLFSRILLETGDDSLTAVALAPMAVVPTHQRGGIGGRLIRHGLDWLRRRGEKVVTVLGHVDYYPRFGFSRDRARAIASPFPADAFMALELAPGVLDGVHVVARYPAAFRL